jgi:hypothetical protein
LRLPAPSDENIRALRDESLRRRQADATIPSGDNSTFSSSFPLIVQLLY